MEKETGRAQDTFLNYVLSEQRERKHVNREGAIDRIWTENTTFGL